MSANNKLPLPKKPRGVLQERRPSLANIDAPPNSTHLEARRKNPAPPLKQCPRYPIHSSNNNNSVAHALSKEKDGCNPSCDKDLVSQKKASTTIARCARPSNPPNRPSQALDQPKVIREHSIQQQQQQVTENAQIKSPARHLQRTKAITAKQVRRLSLKSDRKLEERSKQFELQVRELHYMFAKKDEEMESIRNAGSMLRQLCFKQEEDIKTLQAALPVTIEETTQLRQLCKDQEKELAQARIAIPPLQEQVGNLTEQLKSLAQNLAQLKSEKDTKSSIKQEKSYQVVRSETTSSSCSEITVDEDQPEATSERRSLSAMHKKGLSFVPSNEKRQSGGPREFGRKFWTDKEMTETLQELNQVADREQVALEERCETVFKDLRSSSSRFASLESLKLMLKCTSPRLHSSRPSSPRLNSESADNKRNEFSRKADKFGIYTWNLKPT